MTRALALRRSTRILASASMVAAITWIAYAMHAKAFIAGFVYLILLLPIAFQWGFFEATVASVLAIACLDYFFTQPYLNFSMSDPQDWVALGAFETVVLVVSRLADRLRHHAAQASAHEANLDRLYTLSKELLVIDRTQPVDAQLARLIAEVFDLSSVALWSAHDGQLAVAGPRPLPEAEVRALSSGNSSQEYPLSGPFVRLVRTISFGSRNLGSLCIASSNSDKTVDARTVDAIASLVATAMESERALQAESRAIASRQTERLRAAVLDGLAHTLKTPLATIQTASSGLLEMHRLDAVEEELVTTIQQEAEHLAELTNEALQTARTDPAQVVPHHQRMLIDPFLHTDWSRFAQGLNAQHLDAQRLQIQAADPASEVWADPKLLQLALAQFLDNAAKYAEPGSPIFLRASITDSETIFSVHNVGSYISPQERERIFERYYRSPESRYRASGAGLGLTVAKEIAEAHHGRVWIESEPHSGVTFFLGLPHTRERDNEPSHDELQFQRDQF